MTPMFDGARVTERQYNDRTRLGLNVISQNERDRRVFG